MHEGNNIPKIFFQDLEYFTKMEFWEKIPDQKSQKNILRMDQFWSKVDQIWSRVDHFWSRVDHFWSYPGFLVLVFHQSQFSSRHVHKVRYQYSHINSQWLLDFYICCFLYLYFIIDMYFTNPSCFRWIPICWIYCPWIWWIFWSGNILEGKGKP